MCKPSLLPAPFRVLVVVLMFVGEGDILDEEEAEEEVTPAGLAAPCPAVPLLATPFLGLVAAPRPPCPPCSARLRLADEEDGEEAERLWLSRIPGLRRGEVGGGVCRLGTGIEIADRVGLRPCVEIGI
jgi:hypothetical protein